MCIGVSATYAIDACVAVTAARLNRSQLMFLLLVSAVLRTVCLILSVLLEVPTVGQIVELAVTYILVPYVPACNWFTCRMEEKCVSTSSHSTTTSIVVSGELSKQIGKLNVTSSFISVTGTGSETPSRCQSQTL